MDTHRQPHRESDFVLGLLTGAVVGAGLTYWLAPRLATMTTARVGEAVQHLGESALEQYEQASTRVADAVGGVAQQGHDIHDHVTEVVQRGARVVERFASAVREDRS